MVNILQIVVYLKFGRPASRKGFRFQVTACLPIEEREACLPIEEREACPTIEEKEAYPTTESLPPDRNEGGWEVSHSLPEFFNKFH